MTYNEEKIINYLKLFHSGKGNAITYRDLALDLKINARELRDAVSLLVTDSIAPIASVSTGSSAGGYFYIQTEDEYTQARNELMSRIKKLAKRAKGLRRCWEKQRKVSNRLFDMEVV
jgi:hypothetical protein